MAIYFIQHGVCLDKSIDPKKPLSELGKKETNQVSEFLKKNRIKIQKVYHSGKLRAKETAQILSNHLSDGNIYEKSNMLPNDNVISFCKDKLEDNCIYVGHLPHLDKATSYLVCQNEDSEVIKLKNSGIVSIEVRDCKYKIKWYILPNLCI